MLFGAITLISLHNNKRFRDHEAARGVAVLARASAVWGVMVLARAALFSQGPPRSQDLAELTAWALTRVTAWALTRIVRVEQVPGAEPDGRGSVQVERGRGIRAALEERAVALLPKGGGAGDGLARDTGEADFRAGRQLVRREPGWG